MLEVQSQAALAAVEGEERPRVPANPGWQVPDPVAAVGRLDFHDLSPEIREQYREERPGQQACEIEDPKTLERTCLAQPNAS